MEHVYVTEEVTLTLRPPPNVSRCHHGLCNLFRRRRVAKSVGLAFLSEQRCVTPVLESPFFNTRLERFYMNPELCILLARIAGSQRDEFHIPFGQIETVDKECWITAVRREISEKLNIHLTEWNFLQYFRTNSLVNYVLHRGVPIFIGFYPIDIASLNSQLQLSVRTIEAVEWIQVRSGATISNDRHALSDDAIEIMSLIGCNWYE